MIVRATQLRAGLSIVERNEKGRILSGFPVPIQSVPSGCGLHVHVILEDRRKWCYDQAAEVEVFL